LKKEVLSYFPIISGSVKKSEEKFILLDKGLKDGVKKGQRVILFEETAPLIHPVTKQIIGKSEKIVGFAEIISVDNDSSEALILESDLKLNDKQLFFKIPKSKIKVLYAQTNTEWAIAEGYYRELKGTQRFELIDAPVNVDDIEVLFQNNKGAQLLLLLKPLKTNGKLKIIQELYWIKDRNLLFKSEIELSPTAISKLREKYASLIVPEGHTLLSYRLSRGISRIATGNFDGVSQNQILIVSENEISLYLIDVDLKLKSKYVIPIAGEILWLDAEDIDKDGLDEIILTMKRENRVTSSIIKWKEKEFKEFFRVEDLFLRAYEGRLIAQEFSPSRGFDGELFFIRVLPPKYEKLEVFKLPLKVNIYDFYVLGSTIFKWEDDGTLSVYSEKGVLLWRSAEPMGFWVQYEKQGGIAMFSPGKWSLPTKIKPLGYGVIAIEKKPLLGAVNVSTLGYKSSKLQLIQWTGMGIDQIDITEEMSGEIIDYTVSSDKLFVLVRPPFGFNPKRILEGKNPFETFLHVISLKY
jgi:hypothetical protein